MALVRYILILVTYVISITYSAAQSEDLTTIFFIRHAEKIRNGDPDAGLTEKGLHRSNNWAMVFANADFNAIYSTNTKRTLNTAEPTAILSNLDVVVYDAKTIDIMNLANANNGKTVLIVGHSNTTPSLVNELLGKETYPQIEDNNNGNLYVVTIFNGISNCVLLHID